MHWPSDRILAHVSISIAIVVRARCYRLVKSIRSRLAFIAASGWSRRKGLCLEVVFHLLTQTLFRKTKLPHYIVLFSMHTGDSVSILVIDRRHSLPVFVAISGYGCVDCACGYKTLPRRHDRYDRPGLPAGNKFP